MPQTWSCAQLDESNKTPSIQHINAHFLPPPKQEKHQPRNQPRTARRGPEDGRVRPVGTSPGSHPVVAKKHPDFAVYTSLPTTGDVVVEVVQVVEVVVAMQFLIFPPDFHFHFMLMFFFLGGHVLYFSFGPPRMKSQPVASTSFLSVHPKALLTSSVLRASSPTASFVPRSTGADRALRPLSARALGSERMILMSGRASLKTEP